MNIGVSAVGKLRTGAKSNNNTSSQSTHTSKVLEKKKVEGEVGSRTQRSQVANEPKRFIKHAKHSSLTNTKSILAEKKNNKKTSKMTIEVIKDRNKRIAAYVSTASSKVQSPHDSMCKESASKETKRWKVVGIANKKENISKELGAQKIKNMLNKCKKAVKKDKPLNKLINNILIMSPSKDQVAKNHKRVLSAVNSPTSNESLIQSCATRVASPHIKYKEHRINKSKALFRGVNSLSTSPEQSMYKQYIIPTKHLNKIEEAKEDLVRWIMDCNI